MNFTFSIGTYFLTLVYTYGNLKIIKFVPRLELVFTRTSVLLLERLGVCRFPLFIDYAPYVLRTPLRTSYHDRHSVHCTFPVLVRPLGGGLRPCDDSRPVSDPKETWCS